VLLTCRVMAGGMTKRMTGLSHGSPHRTMATFRSGDRKLTAPRGAPDQLITYRPRASRRGSCVRVGWRAGASLPDLVLH
jgi:hypothetical protein